MPCPLLPTPRSYPHVASTGTVNDKSELPQSVVNRPDPTPCQCQTTRVVVYGTVACQPRTEPVDVSGINVNGTPSSVATVADTGVPAAHACRYTRTVYTVDT